MKLRWYEQNKDKLVYDKASFMEKDDESLRNIIKAYKNGDDDDEKDQEIEEQLEQDKNKVDQDESLKEKEK